MASKTVLLLIPTFSQTIEQRICLGVNEVFAAEDVQVLNIPLGYLPADPAELEHRLQFHRRLKTLNPALVIAYGGGLSYLSGAPALKEILNVYHGIPIVNLGNTLNGFRSVDVDNYEGMHALMKEVISKRPSARYLYFSGPDYNEDSKLRRQALTDALGKFGDESSREFDSLLGDFTASYAEESFRQYLESTPDEARADVIVCANDLTAKGVLDCLEKSNLRCPEDFWVTGFDDFEYAATIRPGLSTVHYPAKDLGAEGARMGLALINAEHCEEVVQVYSYPVLRGSTEHEHPGFGQHEQQLREQWVLVQERDNNARKLTVMRGASNKKPLAELLQSSKIEFADLNVSHLSVFVYNLSEDGNTYYEEFTLETTQTRRCDPALPLPNPFGTTSTDAYWVQIPMEIENEYFGYLVAQCSPVAAEFVEFLTPQYTELLNTELLEARNENYRLQTELNERMASLGSLVSGVAHEINTPIGTGKLASSSILEAVKKIKSKVDQNKLTKSDFENFIEETEETSKIIYQSLDRAAELITNFKMVSVDQTAEAQRVFDLGEYIQSVLISLKHQLKGTNIQLDTDLDSGVMVETFPGAVAQVITNLFMNAKKHGFNNATRAGTIKIQLRKLPHSFSLTFSDDGVGATKEILNHVFDPFFTTTRGKGGSGLGMHIVYNLLHQKLHWSIELDSKPNQGFKATLQPDRPQDPSNARSAQ